MKTGLGVRPELFREILEQQPPLGFLEAHSENYFGESLTRSKLMQCRHHYPISLHGVGLSLGRADALDSGHLQQLKRLVDEVEPVFVSEHLAWSAYSHIHLPDLLPLPLTAESLGIICSHVQQLQDTLARQIFIENPSNYLLFDQLQIPEPEFLNAVAKHTGCGLLLDINNVYVSASNLGRDAHQYIDEIDTNLVRQYHLAGHTEVKVNDQSVLIDTHNRRVHPEVWDLYQEVLVKHGSRPCLMEWDCDYPPLDTLLGECHKADSLCGDEAAPPSEKVATVPVSATEVEDSALAVAQQSFLQQVLHQHPELEGAEETYRKRIWIYQNNVFAAILEYLQEVYPAVLGVVGRDFFRQMSQRLVQLSPPKEGNIHLYGAEFSAVLNEFSSLQELPYLPDLMAYEWGVHKAYFAPLRNPLDPDSREQQELLELPVRLNPSVTIIDSLYPIEQIHRQSLPEFDGQVAIKLSQSEDALLVYKRHDCVETHLMSLSETQFYAALKDSTNLMQVIEAVGGSLSAEEISSLLATVFALQLLETSELALH